MNVRSYCFFQKQKHYVKSVQMRSFFWSVFPCIRTGYRKIRTRKNSVFGYFSRSEITSRVLLKVRFSPSKKFVLVYFNESPLKMIKNAFYFMLKALFVFEIFTFLSWLFGYVEYDLIRKLWLILKFMTSQTGQEIITIHILPSISRSKGNQVMKFGRLKERNLTSIFFLLKNPRNNVMEKLVPDPFIKNQNWAYVWINSLKYKICFCCMSKIEFYQNILKLRCWPIAFTL